MEVNAPPGRRARHRVRQRTRQRIYSAFNSSAALVLLGLLLLMLNLLSSRHHLRWDVSRDRMYELSEKTRRVLETLKEPVKATVFIQPGHEIYQLMFDDVIRLLDEYRYLSDGRVEVEQIDPDRSIARAEDVMNRYGLTEPNVVILSQGERRRVLPAADLFEADYEPLLQGAPPQKIAFRGEQAVTTALIALSQARPPKVYYLQGHGERDLDDRDEYVGLSTLGQMIRGEDIDLAPFSFLLNSQLPDDADALILAAPTRRYAAAELQRIEAYLDRAGRVLLALTPETDAGFGPLLRAWGIESIDNLVVDPTRTLSGFDLLVSDYGEHPITRGLRGITTLFYWPRALPLLPAQQNGQRAADEPRAAAIALSSANAWAETDLEQRPHRFDPDRDIQGPVPVAVAVERGRDPARGLELRPSRLVVFGDIDFASNSGLSGGNGDLFMASLNWLLARENLIAIAPKTFAESRLLIGADRLRTLFWILVVALPLIAASAGVMVRFSRRG